MKRIFIFLFIYFSFSAPTNASNIQEQIKSCIHIFKSEKTESAQTHNRNVWFEKLRKEQKRTIKEYYQARSGFSETFAQDIAKRFTRGEHHSQKLVEEFGYQVLQDSRGEVYAVKPPDDFDVFLKALLARTEKHLASGQEPMIPTLILVKKQKTNEDLPNDISLYKAIPITEMNNLELWPDPNEYTFPHLIANGQLPPQIYFSFVSQGFFPFPVGHFLDHEMGHFTEMYSDPNYTRTFKKFAHYYQIRQDLFKYKSLLGNRVNQVFEFMCLPDLSKKEEILNLAKKIGIQDEREFSKIESKVNLFLNSLSEDELDSFLNKFIFEVTGLIYRQGGGARDSYNLNDRPEASRDSLIGYLKEISEASQLWDSQPFIAPRIARILTGLLNGLDLEITPSDTIRDTLHPDPMKSSKTLRYLNSFLPENSELREIFEIPLVKP